MTSNNETDDVAVGAAERKSIGRDQQTFPGARGPGPVSPAPITENDPVNREVIDALKRQMPPTHGNYSIIGIKDNFFEGKLYSVSFKDGSGAPWWIRVYKTKNGCEVYNDDTLLTVLGERNHRLRVDLLSLDHVTAYIAILLILLIGYLIVFRPEYRIPDLLGNALTTIIGFYFGTKLHSATAR